jgi:2-octaprenyl-6-methoxyphenol hydroxylase
MQKFDLIIVGGGLAGTSLVRALQPLGLSVALVDARPLQIDSQPSFDDRVLALSLATKRILDTMGCWSDIAIEAEAIRHIHISDKGHFGFTRLDAEEESVDALGYVLPARALGVSIYQSLQHEQLTTFIPASLTAIDHLADSVKLTIETEQGEVYLETPLLVAADGDHSFVRQYMNISPLRFDYQQYALICNVEVSEPHNNKAYERFTERGPMALLPMRGNRFAMVWTVSANRHEELLALPSTEFCRQAQQHFGFRAGRFIKAGKVSHYPLTMSFTSNTVRERIVLIGNAAHTLHPIAGQGFNLGIRDVAVLADAIADAVNQGKDVGSDTVLANYTNWRRNDQWSVALATDFLVRTFAKRNSLLALMRNGGMLFMDAFPPLKHLVSRHAMGIAGHMPALLRGVPIARRSKK